MKFPLSQDKFLMIVKQSEWKPLLVKHALWHNLNIIRRIFVATEREMETINRKGDESKLMMLFTSCLFWHGGFLGDNKWELIRP